MQRYRLNLIGPFGLFSPGGSRIEISSQKAVALIAIVVVSSGGVRARRKLEAMLWGSRAPKQAQDSLRRELFNLRKVLTLSQRNSAKHSTPMTSAVYVTMAWVCINSLPREVIAMEAISALWGPASVKFLFDEREKRLAIETDWTTAQTPAA